MALPLLNLAQKHAFRIFYPENKCDEALVLFECPSLSERSLLCKKTFEKICQPISHLNNLVPEIKANMHGFTVPRCRTEQFEWSFIPTMCFSDSIY